MPLKGGGDTPHYGATEGMGHRDEREEQIGILETSAAKEGQGRANS